MKVPLISIRQVHNYNGFDGYRGFGPTWIETNSKGEIDKYNTAGIIRRMFVNSSQKIRTYVIVFLLDPALHAYLAQFRVDY